MTGLGGELSQKLGACPECGCLEGDLHGWGCGMEQCPFCKGSMSSCHDCPDEYCADIDCDGDECDDCDECDNKWRERCEKSGRFPYIYVPQRCARCGKNWPEFFYDPEWDRIIDPEKRELIFCYACYELIKTRFSPVTIGTAKYLKELHTFGMSPFAGPPERTINELEVAKNLGVKIKFGMNDFNQKRIRLLATG